MPLPTWITGIFILFVALQRRFTALAQPDDCPEPHRQLLDDYKAFHDANKHSPDAQYLIQTCWGEACQGTGDRVRGTMWVLRVAIAHRKILLVDWTHPAAITNFLLPNHIDWSFSGMDVAHMHTPNTLDEHTFGRAVYEGVPEAVEAFRANKKHVVTTNQHFYINSMANVTPVEYANKVPIGSCYYHFLFKLNSTIIERGQDHMRQLYGPNPVGNYISWHWRHFDADGVAEQPVHISQLMKTMDCARQLADSVHVDLQTTPLLLISDFNLFRDFVRQGLLANVVTPAITARHMDAIVQPQGVEPQAIAHIDAFTNIFVDLYLMSRARCMLTSRSGFSKLALWMGGNPLYYCHKDMVKCEEEIVWRHHRRRGGARRRLQA